MNIKLNQNFNSNAFRIWLTSQFSKADLKEKHLRAGTVKKVYNLLCGMVTNKNTKIFDKTVDFIARNSRLCKESTLKALNFLNDFRFISIDKGRGRRSNVYQNYLRETGIKYTKHGKSLPYLNYRDFVLLKNLADSRAFKGATFSVLQMILIFAGMKSGNFLASKETLEFYTQLDRRTIDKAFKMLIEKNILKKFSFPLNEDGTKKSPYNRGNIAYQVNRAKLETLCFKKPEYKKPKKKNKVEFGVPSDFDPFQAIKEYQKKKALDSNGS